MLVQLPFGPIRQGYNWQRCCDPLVLGIEADLSYLNASPTALDIETGPTGLNETTSLNSKMDWFGTLRARVGHVVHEDFLLYATGGLAFARLTHTLRDNCVGCGNSPFNLGPFAQSDKDTKVGWTAGGGAEYVHDTRWLFRAEALYVDLGSDSHTYVVTTPVGTGISSGTINSGWVGSASPTNSTRRNPVSIVPGWRLPLALQAHLNC